MDILNLKLLSTISITNYYFPTFLAKYIVTYNLDASWHRQLKIVVNAHKSSITNCNYAIWYIVTPVTDSISNARYSQSPESLKSLPDFCFNRSVTYRENFISNLFLMILFPILHPVAPATALAVVLELVFRTA